MYAHQGFLYRRRAISCIRRAALLSNLVGPWPVHFLSTGAADPDQCPQGCRDLHPGRMPRRRERGSRVGLKDRARFRPSIGRHTRDAVATTPTGRKTPPGRTRKSRSVRRRLCDEPGFTAGTSLDLSARSAKRPLGDIRAKTVGRVIHVGVRTGSPRSPTTALHGPLPLRGTVPRSVGDAECPRAPQRVADKSDSATLSGTA